MEKGIPPSIHKIFGGSMNTSLIDVQSILVQIAQVAQQQHESAAAKKALRYSLTRFFVAQGDSALMTLLDELPAAECRFAMALMTQYFPPDCRHDGIVVCVTRLWRKNASARLREGKLPEVWKKSFDLESYLVNVAKTLKDNNITRKQAIKTLASLI